MTANISVRVSGADKNVSQPSVKVSGAWKSCTGVFVRTGGAWKQAWPGASNNPPVVAIPLVDQSATVGAAFSYTFNSGSFTDPEAGAITYSATPLPAGVTFDGPTRTFSGTPTTGGTTSVVVTATDPLGATVTDTFDIVVAAGVARPSSITLYGSDADMPYGYGIEVQIVNVGGVAELTPGNGTRPLFVGPAFTGGLLPWDADYARPASFGTHMIANMITGYADLGSHAYTNIDMLAAPTASGNPMRLTGLYGTIGTGSADTYDRVELASGNVVTVSGGNLYYGGNIVTSVSVSIFDPPITFVVGTALNGASFTYNGVEGLSHRFTRV